MKQSFFLLALFCSNIGFAATPNVVFILADDMAADVLGAYGHPIVKTPNLDALANKGVVFTRAVVGYPICHVSRAEILTGRCAFQTGVQYRGKALEPAHALWPETFRQHGYRTWFSGKWHNDGSPKQRGFETTAGLFSSGGGKGHVPMPDHAGRPATGYTGWTFKSDDGEVEIDKGVGLTPDTDRYIADGAVSLIEGNPREPFFLQVSLTGPHDPRIEPRGYAGRYRPQEVSLPKNFATQHPFDHGNARGRDEVLLKFPRDPNEVRAELAVYFAVIENIDEQVGRIVSALQKIGEWDNTILIFSSDHGLALGRHGLVGKQNMYEHTIGVPLVMHGTGVPTGQRISAQCYLRDLFPTTCDMVGVPIPSSVQSRSLVPLLKRESNQVYAEVFSCFTDTQRMIRGDRWKLIWYPKLGRYQLFDVIEDPDELYDKFDDPQHAVLLETTRNKLVSWLKQNGDPLFD